ncbi:hypothetical protein CC80DRAFT_169972 [Byssothecium circinans]|uniref:Uncharacterized protein n=1 Tax=Byssothecium circinans TaxID=147558 RepID=A0A6A5TV12_9PLEO|nr:hypothetical protein CC80DRAFT_169972 [Byssothecium circinans]
MRYTTISDPPSPGSSRFDVTTATTKSTLKLGIYSTRLSPTFISALTNTSLTSAVSARCPSSRPHQLS